MRELEVANCDLKRRAWRLEAQPCAFTKHVNPIVIPRFDFTIEFARAIYPENFISPDGEGH